MKIGLATQADLQDWEVDDTPLHAALAGRCELSRPVWDDPSVDWASYDAVLIRTTWDYNDKREAFLRWARAVPRLLNPAEVVGWNVDKTYLAELAERGVPIAPTVWCRGRVDVGEEMATRGWERAFLKPTNGATARETLRFSDPAAGQAHLERCLAAGEVMMLQPYLAEVETRGELSAVFFEGRLSHAVRKVPVAGDYRVQDDFGASDFPEEPTPRVRVLFERIWAALPFEGLLYGRIDLLESGDGHVVTEVELIEPSLFFRHAPGAAEVLAEALLRRAQGFSSSSLRL